MALTNAERQKQFKDRQQSRVKELEERVAELEGVVAAISCLLANRHDPKHGRASIQKAFEASNKAIDAMDWTPRTDIFDEDEEKQINGERAVKVARASLGEEFK